MDIQTVAGRWGIATQLPRKIFIPTSWRARTARRQTSEIKKPSNIDIYGKKMVHLAGIEPATPGLGIRCSVL